LRHGPFSPIRSARHVNDRLALHLAREPQISEAAFVARNATVLGDVTLGRNSSVWYGCVLRGDINSIEVGEGSNVQDGTIVHLADDHGVMIGSQTTYGHAAIVQACEIGEECLL
jgi:carbonic anhydrase/acetyltransferase-like protein (isoleucine patch superfamily)